MSNISTEKTILPTFLLFLILSWPLAAYRFYLRRYASAVLFITFAGFGIWWIVDFILIVTGNMKDDLGNQVKVWVEN